MGKWEHRQISFNSEDNTFTCKKCGVVPVWIKDGRPKCSNSVGSPKYPGLGRGKHPRPSPAVVRRPVKESWPKCRNCGTPTNSEYGYCLLTAECSRLGRICVRYAALVAYGGAKCACCGETRFERLSLDHVNGDGHSDRKDYRKGGGKGVSYSTLKARGFPDRDRYQVLCHNCNMEKGVRAACPCKEASVLIKLQEQGAI